MVVDQDEQDIAALREQIIDNAQAAYIALHGMIASSHVSFKVIVKESTDGFSACVMAYPQEKAFMNAVEEPSLYGAYESLLETAGQFLQQLVDENMMDSAEQHKSRAQVASGWASPEIA